ncbi:MAG TPA: hypothetical protein VGE26_04930 [Sphingobacteriaceae bacterium]
MVIQEPLETWMERSASNYEKISKAFIEFGMPIFDMTEENFLHHPNWDVFTFGLPPSAIDIMVKLKGLSFEDCFHKTVMFEENGLMIRTIHLNDLQKAKQASGRPKDIDDLENLC